MQVLLPSLVLALGAGSTLVYAAAEIGDGPTCRAAPVAAPHPQARGDEPAHQLVAAHVLSSRRDESRVGLVGHVVVVEIEAAAGDAVRRGEGVQLLEVGVADQVRPEAAMRRPARIVDQDRHVQILRTGAATRAGLLSRTDRESGKVDPWCVEISAPSLS